jgi:hypothetical protein
MAVQHDRPPTDLWIAVEAPSPQAVAQHGRRRFWSRRRIICREGAAKQRRNAQHLKEFRRRHVDSNLLGWRRLIHDDIDRRFPEYGG